MQCLNLKVTNKCQNNCSFCFSGSNNESPHRSQSDLISVIMAGFDQGCKHLVFSGGEPTTHPRLIDMIGFSASLGYMRCTIQSNGFRLANRAYAEEVIGAASGMQLAVSISIHGHTEAIHDAQTRKTNSFQTAGAALANMTGRCDIFTNTVVSPINVAWLPEIHSYCHSFAANLIQFSIMHAVDANESDSLSFGDAVSSIYHVCAADMENRVRSEGVPYCLMRGVERAVGESYWPTRLDISNQGGRYINRLDQLACGLRFKPSFCVDCLMNDVCAGVWTECATDFLAIINKPIPKSL